ncbi:hypothetical protein [Bacillus cabrialesii]|nr:hypothetical protein [Bacillus cabrialesii]
MKKYSVLYENSYNNEQQHVNEYAEEVKEEGFKIVRVVEKEDAD